MTRLQDIYGTSLMLLTDLYQLTMAYGYWKLGRSEREASFHLFFRKNPFQGGYTIAAGLEFALDYLREFRFQQDDLDYLAGLQGNDERPLFSEGFLNYLADLRLACDVHAVPEGTVVFPHEPLVRTRGPILQCQLLETPLLNLVNFPTLIATKAARICRAARGELVVEFGLRRAQGIDGGLAASRAAFIGGCEATSNVLAGKLFDIPVKGTHAHSWIMSYDDELESFEDYARAMPNNCIFLVDTYDTLQGVRHAIQVGHKLREEGHKMVGVRLDSGDLAYLSIEARRLLDEAGFQDAAILGSSELDETVIASLKEQGEKINVWGVGTRLATAHDDPALGGVYKISAIKDPDGNWVPRLKLSEQRVKTTNPGILQVRRYFDDGRAIADMLYNEMDETPRETRIIDPMDPTRSRPIDPAWRSEQLLVPVMQQGEIVYESPPLPEIQQRTRRQMASFHESILRQLNPHEYPVGLEERLERLKTDLMLRARGKSS